jgi:hypothetical protein
VGGAEETNPLEGVDWSTVFAGALDILVMCMSAADAEDAASAGVELVYTGKAPWDPQGNLTLVRHVVAVGYNLRRNERKKERRRRRGSFVAELSADMENEKEASPEDAYADEEERAHRRRRLFAACADDGEATLVLQAEDNDVRGVEAQMTYCRLTKEAVGNARKRIARKLRAILHEDEDDEAAS